MATREACGLPPGCISLPVFGQTPATPTQRDLDAKLTVLHRRGAEVLSRERDRSKADLCAKAGPSDLSVGECYLAEGKVTNADYTEHVRVVGALLRLPRYAQAPRHRHRRDDLAYLPGAKLQGHDLPMGGRHTRPDQLPEMPAHGDLGSYE
jgi:hypothetical protein